MRVSQFLSLIVDEINKIRDYFNNEINERKDIIKKLNKCIVSFDDLDKIFTALSASFGTLSIPSYASVVGTPAGIAGSSLTLIFTIGTGISKSLLKVTKKRKKKHNKIIALAKNKLNTIDTLLSSALNDSEINHKEFSNINTTIKQLSKCSMECSFCIWLARNNKAWSSKEIDLSLKTPEDSLFHQNPLSTTSKTNSLKTNSPLPVGFINKGNTCYANAILQVLSVLPSLWIRVPSESSFLSPLLKSINLNMKIKSRSNKPVDPSNFLWALSRKISESRHAPLILTLSKMLLRYYSLSLMN